MIILRMIVKILVFNWKIKSLIKIKVLEIIINNWR